MAISDYCYLLLNKECKAMDQSFFINKLGVTLEIYKNFFYFKCEKFHTHTDHEYTFPTLGQLNEGCINLHGFSINLEVHFNYKYFSIEYTDKDNKQQEFYGIMGSQYHSPEQLLNLPQKSLDHVGGSFDHPQFDWIDTLVDGKEKFYVYAFKNTNHQYRGITKTMVKELVAWVDKELYVKIKPKLKELFFVTAFGDKIKIKESKPQIKSIEIQGSYFQRQMPTAQRTKIVKFLNTLYKNKWQV